jgi:hypothetical protein
LLSNTSGDADVEVLEILLLNANGDIVVEVLEIPLSNTTGDAAVEILETAIELCWRLCYRSFGDTVIERCIFFELLLL